MITLIFLLFLLSIITTVKIWKNKDNFAPISFDIYHTLPLRGILALLIILHHLSLFICNNQGAKLFIWQFTEWGAPVVGIFFFLTGYGLMSSYIIKREKYISNFLSHRFGKLLPAFISSNIIYLLYLSLKNNSNAFDLFCKLKEGLTPLPFSWFIYTIILVYIAFFAAAHFPPPKKVNVLMLLFSFVYALSIYSMHWTGYWFSAIFALNVAITFRIYENSIRGFWVQKPCFFIICVWIVFFLIVGCWSTSYFLPNKLWKLIVNATIPLLIVAAIYTIELKSIRFLRFLGDISLEIYLVHGIFVVELMQLKLNTMLYVIIVYIFSIIFAWLLHHLCKKYISS